ncbi:hypothetical protein ASZ90_010172 [hydrocarbon metagenome]|uniref:Uncharacterized protein n=1 Tax=hydrocarbon metagenome TaxID=938273 RepID=A0A0W8FGT0_9ZZZZ
MILQSNAPESRGRDMIKMTILSTKNEKNQNISGMVFVTCQG